MEILAKDVLLNMGFCCKKCVNSHLSKLTPDGKLVLCCDYEPVFEDYVCASCKVNINDLLVTTLN